MSDHYMQCMDFEVHICSQEIRTMWIRSFQKCDWNKLWETLCCAPWHVISTFVDIDDQREMFHSMLLDSLDKFATLHKVSSRRVKRLTSWFNDCIVVNIKGQNHPK